MWRENKYISRGVWENLIIIEYILIILSYFSAFVAVVEK